MLDLLWILPLGVVALLILWSDRNREKEEEAMRKYFREKQEEAFIKIMKDFEDMKKKKGP